MAGHKKEKWSPSRGAVKWQATKHRQELELELIRLLQRDPDVKYWLGIAAGSGVAALSALIAKYLPAYAADDSNLTPEQKKQKEFDEKKAKLDNAFCGWLVIGAGPAAVLAANPDLLNQMNPFGGDSSSPWAALNSVVGMAGLSFAGFCAAYLLLKAVFGEQGIRKLTGAINDIVPG